MSTIIKAGETNAAAEVPFRFDEMRERARDYLDQVRAEAAEILAAARREAALLGEQARQEAREAAMLEAQHAARQEIGQQAATLMPALEAAVRAVEESKASWILHWESSAVKLASAIAARILRREQQQHPQIAMPLIKEALELASGSAEINVHLNPADYSMLGSQVEELSRQIARLGQAKIISDPGVTAGGCRVNTRFGTIDQQFEAQLARIEQELTGSTA